MMPPSKKEREKLQQIIQGQFTLGDQVVPTTSTQYKVTDGLKIAPKSTTVLKKHEILGLIRNMNDECYYELSKEDV